MARRPSRNDEPFIIPNKKCRPEHEINILLLGPTGVGKSTFINGLVNYMCNDTLQEAVNDPFQSVIPSSFCYTDQETFEEKPIKIGKVDAYEAFCETGESCTQQCRSFVFPVGKRNLRIIDTPGIGDTRGLEQDTKNFHDILTYISQYEHLNGICILLKPNEERLTILFRFCVKELRHIHVSARENIIFVFTSARSTFFAPGATSTILRGLLDQHEKDHQVKVPFSRDNSFLLDNEPFRYLALRKNGIQLNNDQTSSYQDSWDRTVKEYSRLVAHIVTCPLHAVSNMLSLNEAEQLIRKLTRPIAEIAKLIEENIQHAKKHKQNVLRNPQAAYQGIPQNEATVIKFGHPQTVCVGKNCCRPVTVNNETKIEYTSKCHKECYLKGVTQETINDERMLGCEVMDYNTRKCLHCGCSWRKHQHITYEFQTNITRLNERSSLTDIDKRISDLRNEKAQIEDVYKQLSKFLHANALLPFNDDLIEYLKIFIHDEEMKRNAGAQNNDVIQGLEKMMKDFQEEMELFKETIKNERNLLNARDGVKPDAIFMLVGTLYHLPINGTKIREQVNGISLSQTDIDKKREKFIQLPGKANSSTIMHQFKSSIDV